MLMIERSVAQPNKMGSMFKTASFITDLILFQFIGKHSFPRTGAQFSIFIIPHFAFSVKAFAPILRER
jgi:hypothetical protein